MARYGGTIDGGPSKCVIAIPSNEGSGAMSVLSGGIG